jgi:hypothetical protein
VSAPIGRSVWFANEFWQDLFAIIIVISSGLGLKYKDYDYDYGFGSGCAGLGLQAVYVVVLQVVATLMAHGFRVMAG